jgi:hypothetical protein
MREMCRTQKESSLSTKIKKKRKSILVAALAMVGLYRYISPVHLDPQK